MLTSLAMLSIFVVAASGSTACCGERPVCPAGYLEGEEKCTPEDQLTGVCRTVVTCCVTLTCHFPQSGELPTTNESSTTDPAHCCTTPLVCPAGHYVVEGPDVLACRKEIITAMMWNKPVPCVEVFNDGDGCCAPKMCRTTAVPAENRVCLNKQRCSAANPCVDGEICLDDPSDACNPALGGRGCAACCVQDRCAQLQCGVGYECVRDVLGAASCNKLPVACNDDTECSASETCRPTLSGTSCSGQSYCTAKSSEGGVCGGGDSCKTNVCADALACSASGSAVGECYNAFPEKCSGQPTCGGDLNIVCAPGTRCSATGCCESCHCTAPPTCPQNYTAVDESLCTSMMLTINVCVKVRECCTDLICRRSALSAHAV